MCGIAGIVDTTGRYGSPPVELLTRMISAVKHRGPDEFGLYRDDFVGLVHARLSIIDVKTGQQPLCNENGTLWVVFNGEIFNYLELRKELEALGHKFRTHSDTEVIVHAYEAWGRECFPRFNGQWAVALWASDARRLVLSRDRVGVRPLYVRSSAGRVWFASEVKSIFADSSVPRRIDLRGLDQTFTYWTCVAPQTMFEDIEEIRPGSVREFEQDGSVTDSVYWTPVYAESGSQETPLAFSEAIEALEEKLQRATELRMLRADVPVGSYLSGGLDSSLMAWMGRKAKQGDFRTYSIRFEDAEFDETEYQRAMARTLDSSHQELVVRREDIANVFPSVIRHTERPLVRTAPAPLFLLSQMVRDSGIKAVLTGEGADEMLCGYDIFREVKIREFWARAPQSLRRPKLFERLYPYLARSPQQAQGMALRFWERGLDRVGQPGFSHEPRWRTTATMKRFYAKDTVEFLAANPMPDVLDDLPSAFHRWDAVAQAQYLEVVTLLSGYLVSSQGDRMLMAHSVEGRFPFLDADVMAFCNNLPVSYKLAGLNEKFILKKVARNKLPDKIISRPKQPYRAPDAVSFVCPGAPEYVAEMFSQQSINATGILEGRAGAALYEKCRQRVGEGDTETALSNTDNMAFVGILSTLLLHREFVAGVAQEVNADIRFTTFVDRSHQPIA